MLYPEQPCRQLTLARIDAFLLQHGPASNNRKTAPARGLSVTQPHRIQGEFSRYYFQT